MTSEIDGKLKIKPEDNPWYLLATLYGEPAADDPDLRARNRMAWNRFMVAELAENDRAQLINERRHPTEELKPLSAQEMDNFRKAYFQRHQQAASTATATIPDLKNEPIDFSNIRFDRPFLVCQYCFCKPIDFTDATFSSMVDFEGATFCDRATFANATFSDLANFVNARFSATAAFMGATFLGTVDFPAAYFPTGGDFTSATFRGEANLGGANFSGATNFTDAKFFSENAPLPVPEPPADVQPVALPEMQSGDPGHRG
jgi:pentapeptide repeat protein